MEIVKFLKSAFFLFSLLGIALWVGIVWKAESEEEMKEACYPIEWSTDFVHEVIAGLIGREPVWTLRTQLYLMRGCYHFVWRMSQAEGAEETDSIRQHGASRPKGGVRTQ